VGSEMCIRDSQPIRELLDARYEKFRKMGQFFDLRND